MNGIVGVAIGIGLAAACGFRVFVPLLALSIAALSGHLHLAAGFQWIGTWEALVAFAVATAVEVAAYKLPWVDHLLDVLATPAALIAGMVAAASVMTDLPPLVRWSAVVIAGGAAGTVQGATMLARLKSTLMTGGLGNPAVAVGELAGAAATSALALLVPAAALLLVGALCGFIFWRAGRFLFGRRAAH